MQGCRAGIDGIVLLGAQIVRQRPIGTAGVGRLVNDLVAQILVICAGDYLLEPHLPCRPGISPVEVVQGHCGVVANA